jgi:hypothetical protein
LPLYKAPRIETKPSQKYKEKFQTSSLLGDAPVKRNWAFPTSSLTEKSLSAIRGVVMVFKTSLSRSFSCLDLLLLPDYHFRSKILQKKKH